MGSLRHILRDGTKTKTNSGFGPGRFVRRECEPRPPPFQKDFGLTWIAARTWDKTTPQPQICHILRWH